jgi:hypothetical protein
MATATEPEGEMLPPVPAELVMVAFADAACWLTARLLPAIVMRADLAAAAVLAVTE